MFSMRNKLYLFRLSNRPASWQLDTFANIDFSNSDMLIVTTISTVYGSWSRYFIWCMQECVTIANQFSHCAAST